MELKKELPRISFCMPNYNDGDTIGDTIESIFDQDYPNIEMIVCDDGSTDKSLEVLAKKQKKFKGLKVIQGRHKGASFARNLAAKEATGDYISFLPADAILYPGVVRTWINHLEDNPDYDFLYGGYRFVDSVTRETLLDYTSEPFDPYMLKIANYIDGSFPLRKSLYDKMGGWDVSLKSLQDWDFWLNAVMNHNAKGLFLPEVFFETTYPHDGGLSDDSHKNWKARTTQIKAKYGLKEHDICVTSKGAPFHGIATAKILEADYKNMPQFKPHNHKMIYLLGFYPSMADHCAAVFENHKGLRIVHWIGSDIMQLHQLPTYHKEVLKKWMQSNIDLHLTEFKTTQKELAAEGIKSKILPLPPEKFYDINPMPEKFTVAVYMPRQNAQLYLPEFLDELTKKCRDVEFKFFGDFSQGGRSGNREYLGRLDKAGMQKLIDSSSCYLRLVKHDGLSITTEEFLTAGRPVITNVPNIPNTIFCPAGIKEVMDALDSIKKIKEPNMKVAKVWRNKLSHKKFKQFFDNLLKIDTKEYWENRAECWEEIQGESIENKDEIIKQLKKLEPKSLVDLGCGNGNWAKIISEELPNAKYFGVDISKKMISYAKKRNPKLNFNVIDLRKASKIGEKFDVGFTFTSLLHVPPESIKETIEELKKVCTTLVCVEPVKEAESSGQRYLHDRIIKEHEKGNIVMHPNSSFVHNYRELFGSSIVKEIELGARSMFIVKFK